MAAAGGIFATAGSVLSDSDGAVFVLSLRVKQGGKVVARGTATATADKGKSADLRAFTGVSPVSGKYAASSVLTVVEDGGTYQLDSKECEYTQP